MWNIAGDDAALGGWRGRCELVTAYSVSNKRSEGRLADLFPYLGRRFRNVASCTLVLDLDDGRRLEFSSGRPGRRAHVRVRNRGAFRRLRFGGAIGGAESYVDGDWDTPDLSATLEFFSRNEVALGDDFGGGLPARMVGRLYHLTRANTRRGSRRNIAAHYDLGNDFYEA